MRNKDVISYLGLWEKLNNPEFKGLEFTTFENRAGKNSFYLSPQKWIETTNAIGIISKSGNNGGTFAHRDIAFQFGKKFMLSVYDIKRYYPDKTSSYVIKCCFMHLM